MSTAQNETKVPDASAPNPTAPGSHRIAAIDWMRGFVMVLMAIDHASQMWNAGRRLAPTPLYLPSLDLYDHGARMDSGQRASTTAQFFTRWVTHLCAPTFLFLSGTSLAMSFEKRRAEGMPAIASSIDIS